MKLWRWLHLALAIALLSGPTALVFGQATPASRGFAVTVLMKSPADTKTDLQIFCLFRSTAANPLHGALSEVDEKLHGLLGQIRSPAGFNGDLGETVLFMPPVGTIAAKRVLIIGLGDSSSFTPERMYLVGKIAFREANRLGVAHPFFAPTVLDGGVTQYSTGEVAEKVVRGFRDALANELLLHEKNAATAMVVTNFTYLAGAQHAADTKNGVNRALGKSTATSQ